MNLLICLIFCVLGGINALPTFGAAGMSKLDLGMEAKQQNPQFPPMPPELEKLLPSDVVQKLKAVHGDASLTIMQKQEKIDRIMTSLPAEILDKIPAPPGFERLPDEVKQKLKQINRQKEKAWQEKQRELQAYVQTLPAEQRALLMMGPMGPPPPQPSPNFGRRR